MKLALKYKFILYVYATLPLVVLWIAAQTNNIHAMPAFQHALTIGFLSAFALPLVAPCRPLASRLSVVNSPAADAHQSLLRRG